MPKENEITPSGQEGQFHGKDDPWIVDGGKAIFPMSEIAHLAPNWKVVHLFDFMLFNSPPQGKNLIPEPGDFPDPIQVAELYGPILKKVYQETHEQIGLPSLDTKISREEVGPDGVTPGDIAALASTCIQKYLRMSSFLPKLNPEVKQISRQYKEYWQRRAQFSDALDWECVRIFGVEINRD